MDITIIIAKLKEEMKKLFATKEDVPTKTSDLINDNDFITNSDSRLSDSRTPTSHNHGQISNDGKITREAVIATSTDKIIITDADDYDRIKRTNKLLADHIQDTTAHSNIGSSANATQATINTNIDTALSGKEKSSNKVTSISSSNTDTQYPSAKCVYDNIKNKLEVATETALFGSNTVWIATSSDKTNKNGWKIKAGAQNTFTNITYTNTNISIGNAEVSITYQNKIKRPIKINYTITYNNNQQSNTKTATVNPGEEIYDIFISTPEPEPDYSGDGNSIDDNQEWMRYVYNVKSVQYTIYGQSSSINAIANICYPVGSVYTSTDNINPIFIFGGEWEGITSETNNYRWKRL